MGQVKPPHEYEEVRDERDREEQRYRIYVLPHDGNPDVDSRPLGLTCIAATPTLEGIGVTLDTLREEGQIGHNTRVGIKDDVERTWLINPFAKGDM